MGCAVATLIVAWLPAVSASAAVPEYAALPLHTRHLATSFASLELAGSSQVELLSVWPGFPWGRLAGELLVVQLSDGRRFRARFSAVSSGELLFVHPDENRDNRVLAVPEVAVVGIDFTPAVATAFEDELRWVVAARIEAGDSWPADSSDQSEVASRPLSFDIAAAYYHYQRQLAAVDAELKTIVAQMDRHPKGVFVGLTIGGAATSLVAGMAITNYTIIGDGTTETNRIVYGSTVTALAMALPMTIYGAVNWRRAARVHRGYADQYRPLKVRQQHLRSIVNQLGPLAGAVHRR